MQIQSPIRTILYAEDNAQDVELTLGALNANGIVNGVVVVSDGAEALDYLYRRNQFADRAASLPSVVLLDLKMPKVNGLEVLRTIKSDITLSSVPVVMLTSSREEQDLVQSYQLGVNAYVVKPVDFQAFVSAVQQLGIFWTVHNQPPHFFKV